MTFIGSKKLVVAFAILILIYLVQILFAPIDKITLHRYHITTSQTRALGLTVALPYIIIWLVALIGYLRLKTYSDVIAGSKDGKAFETISKGVLLFALWLPLSSIIGGLVAEYYGVHHETAANLVRINNYFNTIFLLPAFWLVKRGSQQLLTIVKKPTDTVPSRLMLIYIAVSALYVLLVLHDPARFAPTHDVNVANYYEPDWLIIISLVIPRLIAWFWGFQAFNNILLYRKNVKGKLYKAALNSLATGLMGILIMTILLRSLQSVTTQLSHWSLAVVLAVIYLLLIIICIGYVFIAVGAKNLQKLEEL